MISAEMPTADVSRNTTALFSRVSRNSARAILPINDCALDRDAQTPAFYCVHSISGVAGTDFVDLAQRLEPSVRFYGIQAPPRLMQLTEFGNSVESIADYYCNQLVKFQPTGPLVLGGYCAGAVIALAMARNLTSRGRTVGPLVAINGTPENARSPLARWNPRYWAGLARNLPRWAVHADLVRSRSLRAFSVSISKNLSALGKGMIGLERSQKLGGGFAMDGLMDLTIFPPAQQRFINRLVNAMFAYVPQNYPREVLVYEATTTPLLYLPQIGSRWQKLAPHAEIVETIGTHLGIMHQPYVDAFGKDLRARIIGFYETRSSD